MVKKDVRDYESYRVRCRALIGYKECNVTSSISSQLILNCFRNQSDTSTNRYSVKIISLSLTRFNVACVAWRFWLLGNKGGRGQKNFEEIGAGMHFLPFHSWFMTEWVSDRLRTTVKCASWLSVEYKGIGVLVKSWFDRSCWKYILTRTDDRIDGKESDRTTT